MLNASNIRFWSDIPKKVQYKVYFYKFARLPHLLKKTLTFFFNRLKFQLFPSIFFPLMHTRLYYLLKNILAHE